MAAPAAALDANLLTFLRQETREEHRSLEQALDLLRLPLEHIRFREILARFYGFHVVWEETASRLPALAAISEGRSRLSCLREDLMSLGLTDGDIVGLPRCTQAEALAASEPVAIGCVYVIEGSTLGGQVISRALAGADWLPPGGLSYFNPYRSRTAAMWQSFRAWADSQADRLDWDVVASGARATFGTLQDWLPR